MMRYRLLFLFLCISVNAFAQWSTDPAQNLKVAFGGILPQICIDGSGGCYIVWETGASGNRRLLRMQHLDRLGYKTMPDSLGMPLGGEQIDQATPFFVEYGGNGTALVFFYDTRFVNNKFTAKVLVQRVDSAGTLLWGNDAMPLNQSDSTQLPLAFLVEDDGGSIGFWGEDRDGDSIREVYSNRISPGGQLLWGMNGKKIANFTEFNVTYTKVASDGNGGVYITFTTSKDLFVQHLDRDGNFLWPTPVQMPTAIGGELASDNMGGFFWVAHEALVYRPGTGTIYRTRVFRYNDNGESIWLPEGVAITDSAYRNTFAPEVFVNGTEDVVVIYRGLNGEHDNIFVQRVDLNGELLHEYGGIPVSEFPSTRGIESSVQGIDGNIISVFLDGRSQDGNLYAQILDGIGKGIWEKERAITLRPSFERNHRAASDGAGGCIVTWYEIGTGSGWGIWAQQISRNGNLGEVLTTSIPSDSPKQPLAVPIAFEVFPNPFRDSIRIDIATSSNSLITVQIFDITGRIIRELRQQAGNTKKATLQWDGTNQAGKEVANGLYFMRIQTKEHAVTGKILFIR